MNIIQLFQTCLRSIMRNRMRSLLTSLGIIIGVGSVIIMVAVGGGTQNTVEGSISAMGTNLLQVMPKRQNDRSGQSTVMRTSGFTKNDLQKLKDEASYTTAISGVVTINSTVVGSEGNAQVSIVGVEPDYLIARNYKVKAGIFFNTDDVKARSTVAVLGRTTAKNLFGIAENALSQRIRIGKNYYTVIGLLESKGAGFGGMDQDDIVMVPLDTAMTRLSNSSTINMIAMSIKSKEYMNAASKEARLILCDSRGIANDVNADFDIMNMADMINMAATILGALTALLAAVAGVSLLVGGIGIMNIMLVSVTERTREIGIRMAIGGRKRDILFQFLTESAILSLLGGVLGIGLAFLVCYLLSLAGLSTIISPVIVVIATMFAAFVGIVFGYYPASKAAKLYPIDALRYE